jgi:cytochrome c-type biogenesis protein CcmH
MLAVAGVVFVVVAGIGAGTSYWKDPPKAAGSGDANSELFARLNNYARSIPTDSHAAEPAAGKLLPDVNVMVERLAARLATAPQDGKGWRMLGWSYFNIGRYEEAAAAYAKASALDPNSAEIKLAYEEAKARAAGRDDVETASTSQVEAVGKDGNAPRAEPVTKNEVMPLPERDPAIRAMVDGLANRLESSPRDVEGWTRLMRSRVVLGQRDVAANAFRKALEIFKDDQTASGKITAAAMELGLRAE